MKLQQIVHFLTLPTLNDSIMVLERDDKVQFQQMTIATDDISVKSILGFKVHDDSLIKGLNI